MPIKGFFKEKNFCRKLKKTMMYNIKDFFGVKNFFAKNAIFIVEYALYTRSKRINVKKQLKNAIFT